MIRSQKGSGMQDAQHLARKISKLFQRKEQVSNNQIHEDVVGDKLVLYGKSQ